MVGQVVGGQMAPRVAGVCDQPSSKGFRSNCGGDVCECCHDDRAGHDVASIGSIVHLRRKPANPA
jgi:hypothetical protein